MVSLLGRRPEYDNISFGPSAGVEDREYAIEGSGFGGKVRGQRPCKVLLLFAILLLVAASSSCGGGNGQAQPPPPSDPAQGAGGGTGGGGKAGEAKAPASGGAGGGNTVGGATVASGAQAESLKDSPFTLNQRQPVPQDFRQAYQRKALIVVEFYQKGEDPFYPRGLEVDDMVNRDLRKLRGEYEDQGVEFFAYDISKPGNAETSEELNKGEYGSLAAQLGVGYTPFIAMLAPRGEGYAIENLFQGYVEEGVLNQALYDLVRTDVGGNSSKVDVNLDQIELTESGGGIEYVTVVNQGSDEVDLSGFVLNVVDQESGDTRAGSQGLRIENGATLAPGERGSIGRAADVVDADGRQVIGTFSGAGSLRVQPGDQVALLEGGAGGGAVIDNITVP